MIDRPANPLQYEPKFEFVADTHSYAMMGPSAERIKEDLIQAFNRDVEGKIRQVLIDLGWTPPAKDKG